MVLRKEVILERLKEFRNILIHRYLSIDSQEVLENYQKGLAVFPRYAQNILTWLEELDA